MNSRLNFSLTILCLATTFISCHKKCRTTCQETDLSFYARGYTLEELDTVYISEFIDNGKFDQLKKKDSKFNQFTTAENSGLGIQLGLFDKHSDWMVEIPSVKKVYRISAITDQGKTFVEEDCRTNTFCQNEIVSFDLDGIERVKAPAYLER